MSPWTIIQAVGKTPHPGACASDNGSNFTLLTLTDTGLLFSTGVKIATTNKVSTTSGTQLKYKVEFANQGASKKTEVSGVSLIY